MASWWPLAELEDQFNHTSAILFMNGIWHYSFFISLFYVISIFALQNYMRDRPKYHLRGPLMVWSLLLSAFSFSGFFRAGLHHLLYMVNYGWGRSVCDPVLNETVWSFLFCFSKLPELIDTYFIVLRKQRLIFLHWYHHITVFIYCWFSYSYITNPQQWFITMNYFVHSIMYLYYAIRASSFYRPPVWVNIVITSLQLLQMAVGVWVNIYIFINMRADPEWYCDGKIETTYTYVYLAFAMYASYLVLFANFFYTAYIYKKAPRSSKDHAPLQKDSAGHVNNTLVFGNGTIYSNGIVGHNKHVDSLVDADTATLQSFTRNGIRHRN